MHVYRRPHEWWKTSNGPKRTETKQPKDYIEGWRRTGETIWFNGNINATERFSDIGIELGEDDAVALFGAVLKRYRRAEERRKKHLEKICRLIEKHGNKASPTELIEAVHRIAQHGCCHYSHLEENPELEWINYANI
jgi:hypothetical protein